MVYKFPNQFSDTFLDKARYFEFFLRFYYLAVMTKQHLLLVLIISVVSVTAQLKGDIGVSYGKGDWKIRGGVSYDFVKGKASVEVKLTYDLGRRRRSLQIGTDGIIKAMCKECISVETITSPEKLDKYARTQKVDFSMIARFKRFYQNEKETILSFKIKEILTQPPTNFNITEDKFFNVYAEKGPCALVCLKEFVNDDYIVTGAMFHGRLIIYDKLILYHPRNPKVNSQEYNIQVDEEENRTKDHDDTTIGLQ